MAKKGTTRAQTRSGRQTRLRGEVARAASEAGEPGPEHWRYLDAVTDLLESAEDFTTRSLAERLQMSPVELHKFRHERPDVMRWASDQLGANAHAMVGPLLRRVAQFAQAGSAEHADLLLRVASRAWSVVAGPGTASQAGPLVVNIVVGDHPSNA